MEDLDRQVAEALGYKFTVNMDGENWRTPEHEFIEINTFSPSTNWAQGGPLIEEYKIDVLHSDVLDEWQAQIDSNGLLTLEYSGETPLIAAMKALVASK